MSLARTRKTIEELEREGAIVEIQDGNHGELHPKADEYTPAGVSFIMASDIKDGRLDLDSCNRLPKSRTDRLRIGFARRGDVLLTHKGSVGRVAIVPDVRPYVMLTPQVTYYRTNPEKLDPRYLAIAFRAPDFQRQLLAHSLGQSTRAYISITAQRHLCVILAPPAVQSRIVDVISAYDDLIENNTRRIAILEEMARRCFQHAISITERFLRRTTLDRICSLISRGITPRYDDSASTLVINQKCIRDGRLSLEPARKQSKAVPAERVLRPGDILINSTGVGTLGRVAQVEEVPEGTCVDTHITVVRPNSTVDPTFFGLALLALEEHFKEQGTGSTGQTELNRSRIGATEIALLPDDEQRRFGETVRPMRRLAHVLGQANFRLRAARDLLLPKLISGEIEVGAAPLPEAAAAE